MGMIQDILHKFQKKCSTCQGTGVVVCHCNDNDEIICPNCLGSGSVEKSVVVNTKSEIPCDNPQCHDGQVTCSLCHGSGRDGHGEACAQCGGTGVTTCAVCGGLGRITRNVQETWIRHEVCPICQGAQTIPCPYCQGTKSRICPVCHGEGQVLAKGKIVAVAVLVILVAAMPMLFITLAGMALTGIVLYMAYQYFPPTTDEAEQAQTLENDAPKDDQDHVAGTD